MAKRFTFADLNDVVTNTKRLLVGAESDIETIDILGEISTTERGLASLRRGTQAEYQNGDSGKKWRLEQGRKSENSHNTPLLIVDFAKARQEPLWNTFVWLWRNDILRVTWQHTKLLKAASEEGMTLVTAPHEIEEGDEAHIGTYWKDGYPAYKPVVDD